MAISGNRIISIIAHDLKDPLISIAGITELLITNNDDFSEEEKKEILTEIHDTADGTLRLLGDLLEWSKQTADSSNPILKKCNAFSVINETTEPFRRFTSRKNIFILNRVPTGLDVFADEHVFAAIIRNLLTNSIKSCPRGGEITISAKTDEKNVTLCIQDNGVGIEASRLKELFSGKKSSGSGDSTYGNGFGLILCRDFVAINKGTIWAESEEGLGTGVFFTVPLFNEKQ